MSRTTDNLFGALSRWVRAHENFHTEALAWLLRKHPEVRRAFFELCGALASLDPQQRKLLAAFRDDDELRIDTRYAIRPAPNARHCYPDLHFERLRADGHLLIEVKAFAPATLHEDDGEHSARRTAEDHEDRRYVAQTERYRRWLAQQAPGSVLLALIVNEDEMLTKHCHGVVTWQAVHDALRTVSAVPLSGELCSFLEAQAMASPPASPVRKVDVQATSAVESWLRWHELLQRCSARLAQQARKNAKDKVTIRLKRKKLQIWPDPIERSVSIWSNEVEAICNRTVKYSFTLLILFPKGAPPAWTVYVWSWDRDERPIVNAVSALARKEPGTGEVICQLDLRGDLLALNADEQLTRFTDAALHSVVRPLLKSL